MMDIIRKRMCSINNVNNGDSGQTELDKMALKIRLNAFFIII